VRTRWQNIDERPCGYQSNDALAAMETVGWWSGGGPVGPERFSVLRPCVTDIKHH